MLPPLSTGLTDDGVQRSLIAEICAMTTNGAWNIGTCLEAAREEGLNCGNLIVIFLAGLQNVPRVYHEAAEIDGANSWQRFVHVTVPSMTPIIFYNLLMSLITNMQVVTPALALTNGGPGNSSMFITYFVEGIVMTGMKN